MDELLEDFLLASRPSNPQSSSAPPSSARDGLDPHLRPRLPPQVPRAPPRAAGAGLPLQPHPPASSFRPRRGEVSGWVAIHSCHGPWPRPLLQAARRLWCGDRRKNSLFLVWDPMADEQRELRKMPMCPYPSSATWNAAVLCSSCADAHCMMARTNLYAGMHSEDSQQRIVLMALEDGRLGFATVQESKLTCGVQMLALAEIQNRSKAESFS